MARFITLIALSIPAVANLAPAVEVQSAAPLPASELSMRREIFHNDRVTAFLLEIPPGQATPMHRHEKDFMTVVVSGGQLTCIPYHHAPESQTVAAGEVRFRRSGFMHSLRNDGPQKLRIVVLEFEQRQGNAISELLPVRHHCNAASRSACTDEKHLFCTLEVCVEDVSMEPGATRSGFASGSNQMLVAVSDYELAERAAPVTSVVRSHARASGQVQWVPAGTRNRWTNQGAATAHFILIRFDPRS